MLPLHVLRSLLRLCCTAGLTALLLLTGASAASAQDHDNHRVLKEHRLFPGDPVEQTRFGYSSSISGNFMVIGAFIADGAVPGSGAAYVFERENGHWIQRDKIFADDGAEGDGFGSSASMSGDTIVIGAPFATVEGVEGAGAAYIFRRAGSAWLQEARVPTPDPRDFGGFADDLGVAVSGDAIAISDGSAFQPPFTFGAILVYTRHGSIWTQSARLTVPHEPSFGSSVSISHDVIVVGASTADTSESEFAGAVYIFQREHGHWARKEKLTARDGSLGAQFGFSVAIADHRIAVGALNAGVAAHAPGAVYVFNESGDSWKQEAKLTASDGADSDILGFRVGISGATVLAGAENRTLNGNPAVGAAYIFQLRGRAWKQIAELIPTDAQQFELFGCSTAIDGDALVVGAGGQTTKTGAAAGEAYTYQLGGRRD